MAYRLKINAEAHEDIQKGIDWYNSRQPGLGRRFHVAVKQEFKALKNNPFFQIRYQDVHCLPLKKFPYMVHFIIEEDKKRIVVLGVINTYKSPENWHKRKSK